MSLWETFHRQYESRKPLHANSSSQSIEPPQRPQLPSNNNRLLFMYDEQVLYPGRTSRIRQWGRHLARKKMVQSSSSSCKTTSKDHDHDDSNRHQVIYRQREDWSRQQGYLACSFLDTQDTVLACDRSGCIDVIRIPPHSHDCHDVPDDASTKLGTVLLDALDLRLRDYMPLTPPKIQSLQGGQAFVVAWGGSFHVFASERLQSWGQDRHLPPTNFAARSPSLFFTTSWTIQGPRRKYYREYHHKALSLAALANNDNNNNHHRSNNHSRGPFLDQSHLFQEIQGWNDAVPKVEHSRLFRYHKRAIPSSHWDFYETGSSLLAARVDSEQDSFWMRLMDDRIHHEPILCVDTTSQDTKLFCEEHVVACAFASNHLLATAHVTCTVPSNGNSSMWHSTRSSNKNAHGGPVDPFLQSFVKLWDIRMISTARKENSLSTIYLPPFPTTTAVAMAPMHTVDMPMDSQGSNNFVLSSLTSSTLGRGTILLTAHSLQEAIVDHYMLNLGHLGLERIYRQHYQNEFPLFGTSANHDVLACVEQPHEIMLFDIQEKGLQSSRPKRRIDGSHKHEENKNKATHCHLSAQIPLDIKDRHGLETHLSCLAMNAPGTFLVGGSIDGDLVVWRGP